MKPWTHIQLRVRELLQRDLLTAGFYAHRARRQGLIRSLRTAVQAQIPYALPLPRFPSVLGVEPTNHCNLLCTMCPSPAQRSPRGYMAQGLYDDILRQGSAGGARRIRFIGLGEPLLHPDLPRMVRAAHDAGIYTEVTTNATLLTRDLGVALLDAGLDEIAFSLDSADEAEFERIRRGARFREVMDNVETFLSLCAAAGERAPVTVARMVVLGDAGVEPFVRRWQGKVDSLQFNVVRVYAGTRLAVNLRRSARDLPLAAALHRRTRCRQIWSYLNINWDGRVSLCNQTGVIVGDTNTTPIAEIWRGGALQKVRALHQRYEGMRVSLCRGCPVMMPSAPSDQRRIEEAQVTVRPEWRDEFIDGGSSSGPDRHGGP